MHYLHESPTASRPHFIPNSTRRHTNVPSLSRNFKEWIRTRSRQEIPHGQGRSHPMCRVYPSHGFNHATTHSTRAHLTYQSTSTPNKDSAPDLLRPLKALRSPELLTHYSSVPDPKFSPMTSSSATIQYKNAITNKY